MVRQEVTTFSCKDGSAAVVSRDELQQYEDWRNAFRDCCKDHRFYEIIEDTLANDFEYQYLILRDLDGNVRGIQPFFFVQQNLVEGIPGGVRYLVDSIRKKFPKFLTMRVLMVGCAAGEGHLGALASKDSVWIAEALHACLSQVARAAKASLIVLKDFSSKYRNALAGFSANGFTRVPSMPMTRLALNFRDLDDSLVHLSYGTRKSLRRKFRKTERAGKIDLEIVSDITPHLDEVYPLYLAVHERSDRKSTRLNSSHTVISYAVFCLKKKKTNTKNRKINNN